MTNEVDDFLNGGGDFGPSARSAKWGKERRNERCRPGAVEKGIIVEDPFLLQQRAYKADGTLGELLFWPGPDGKTPDTSKPRMQLKVIIQTDHKDDPDDDGRRAIFVTGPMKKPVTEAIRTVGAPGLRKGGWLAVKCVEIVTAKSGYDTYVWEAKYAPPPPVADDFTSGDDMEPPASLNHRGEAQSQTPPDWAEAEPENVGAKPKSTLEQIRAGTAAHQARLKPDDDFEPPY